MIDRWVFIFLAFEILHYGVTLSAKLTIESGTNDSLFLSDKNVDSPLANVCIPLPDEKNVTEPVRDLHELLTWGLEQMANFSDATEAIFLLGNTGAGKSTVTQIIAGNLSSLHAVHVVGKTYVILDESGLIGLPTTVSKTLIPNLVKKVEVSPPLSFYDFPGFDDTRDSTHDIAANFFMNEVTRKVANTKLLFIVNYSSVSAGNDKLDFDKLAKHANTLVKNIEKFYHSMALIVNKVNNYDGEVDDPLFIDEIVRFLKTYGDTLYSELQKPNLPDRELIMRKIAFVEALLEQDSNGNFHKIWFVPTPKECGPLNESDIYTRTREKLTNLYEPLSYTRINSTTDFGFTLKPESILYIENYTNVINSEISAMVSNVTKDLSQKYFETLADLRSRGFNAPLLNKTTQQHDMAFNTLNIELDDLIKSNHSNPTAFHDSFKKFSISLGFSLTTDFESFMRQQENFLVFFDDVSQRRQERQVREWSDPLIQFEESFADFRDWYEFCAGLQTTVHHLSFHLNIPTNPPLNSHFEDWLNYIKTNNIVPVNQRIQSIIPRMNQQELNIMTDLMNYALAPTDVRCFYNERTRSDTLIITGNLFRLGKFLPQISTLITTCENSVNEVYFLAGHTIFIDSDMELLDIDVALLAPNLVNAMTNQWNVLLRGRNAAAHNPPTATAGRDGTNGNKSGTSGNHGCEGRPGKPGGSALIIVTKLESSSRLVLHSKGGTGSAGQHGGKGGVGFSRNAQFPDYEYIPDAYEDSECTFHFGFPTAYYRFRIWNYGIQGGNGGNGGNGGKGGLGGVTGRLTVIELGRQDYNELVEYQKSKVDGQGGSGGQRGLGGRAGDGYRCTNTHTLSCRVRARWDCYRINPSWSRDGLNGANGENSTSSACSESPEPARLIPEWEPILKYRIQFLNASHPTTKMFLQQIDESNKTSSFFSLKSLAEELFALESYDRSNANVQVLVEMYDSLTRRLRIFSELHYENSNSEQRKLVKILLTSAFSSLMSLNGPLTTSIVVDVAGYFNNIRNQIDTLFKSNALASILQTKQDFVERLQDKISVAFNYIDNIVTPAVYEAGEDMKLKMEDLETQLANLITDAELSVLECKEKLRRAEATQGLLKFLKIFGLVGDLAATFIPGFVSTSFEILSSNLEEQHKNNPDEIQRLKALLEEAEKLVVDLEKKQKKFQDEFVPLIGNVVAYFRNISQSLGEVQEISGPQLGITKWQAISALKNCKISLDELSDGALKIASITNAFDKIQDAMVLTIELYQMSEEYMDTQRLAQYIADVHSAQLGPISITDPQFVHTIYLYDQRLMENMLNIEIQKAIHAFKQWIFPFPKFYLPPTINFVRNNGSDIGDNQLRLLEQLNENIKLYKASVIPGHDSFIINMNFTSGAVSSRPFFTWRNEVWSQNINSLLQGHKINFNADIRQHGFTGWEAIKFKQIEINLRLNNATTETQENFDCVLKYFGVRMTHSGISYYRFQREYFVMTGRNMTIQFNFEREPNGDRRGTNEVYNKFKNGDYLLSPYTVWTIQLFVSVPPTNMRSSCIEVTSAGFDMLTKYAHLIDMELVGMGTYVMGNEALAASGGNLELDKFYEPGVGFRRGHVF